VKIPGTLYSLLLAIATWVAEYFGAGGEGESYWLAPVIIAGVGVLLKTVTVYLVNSTEEPMARGFTPQPTKPKRWLLG
jgi:hypothetical protein